jgi:Fungal specific transcription factor domain/Fungal Zn(2)-Cys(6) binuclear cluster domain
VPPEDSCEKTWRRNTPKSTVLPYFFLPQHLLIINVNHTSIIHGLILKLFLSRQSLAVPQNVKESLSGPVIMTDDGAVESSGSSNQPQQNINARISSDLSSYVHKFRAAGDTSQKNASTKVNKRNRQPLSCNPCRSRKLRCDRQHPCETCVKRNEESSCTYTKQQQTNTKDNAVSRSKAQDRLRNLEQLVMQAFESRPSSKTPSSFGTATEAFSPDGTSMDGSLDNNPIAAKYAGSTHWSAILENIKELKSALVDEPARRLEIGFEDQDTPDHEILFGAKSAISLQQILAQSLPPRIQVDRLLAMYFNARYMVLPYIHTYQFQRQYEQFWRHQLSTPPLWVSILFSICCLGLQLTQCVGRDTPGPDNEALSSTAFLAASAQCLILGGYTRPRPHIVEALALYAQCKYNVTLDPSGEVGVIFALLTRLAFRMAYHRDPDNFPQMSVFEGEMRRRVWTMCIQYDLMVSFQLGLPNNIPLDSWDTKSPRNLLDSDFDENITVLPPSRPESEPTQILYFIVKSRLMAGFGRVCNHALSFRTSSLEEVMKLDAMVRTNFSQVPYTLRIRPMSQCFADPPYLLMVRLNCEFLYQKSLLVLHRRYMVNGFEESAKLCLDAALAIIQYFSDIHKEFQPGGALYRDRWMLTSFTINDFLLASMILCLSLSQWQKDNPNRPTYDDASAARQMQHLKTCYDICQDRASLSAESRKVAHVLKAMLIQMDPEGFGVSVSQASKSVGGTSLAQTVSLQLATNETDRSNPAAIKSIGARQADTEVDPLPNADLGPFENFLEGTDNIDWTALDQYLVNPGRFDDESFSVSGLEQRTPAEDPPDWVSVPFRYFAPPGTGPPGYRPPNVPDPVLDQEGKNAFGNVGVPRAGLENGFIPSY